MHLQRPLPWRLASVALAVACVPSQSAETATTAEAAPPMQTTPNPDIVVSADPSTGVLGSVPNAPASAAGEAGTHRLGLGTARDGVIHVPATYRATAPAPLLVMLHGAGGDGLSALAIVKEHAEREGVIVVAPDSRQASWDIIVGAEFGPDVTFIDRSLRQTFERYVVDSRRVAVGGFSDGASYALSLGIASGHLFQAVLAFSPGFSAPAARNGSPRIFVSHGDHDDVLPINACSRRLVPRLQAAGYQVTYEEFDGPHTVPQRIAKSSLEWFLSPTR
jgi:phospholipase/carboxylesterase